MAERSLDLNILVQFSSSRPDSVPETTHLTLDFTSLELIKHCIDRNSVSICHWFEQLFGLSCQANLDCILFLSIIPSVDYAVVLKGRFKFINSSILAIINSIQFHVSFYILEPGTEKAENFPLFQNAASSTIELAWFFFF
ncbi:hypothetical protein BpHYR1_052594 [Brachionus plicatilis]|uniref:Uncharacterized protein n=1 Tax=Brachionus plicatilis TaxID=10195 RepID=A0A3M7Q3M6_BRAPC|nr:hypothetical protein BpHYR1_052594 [Brachionus plicatilis]